MLNQELNYKCEISIGMSKFEVYQTRDSRGLVKSIAWVDASAFEVRNERGMVIIKERLTGCMEKAKK